MTAAVNILAGLAVAWSVMQCITRANRDLGEERLSAMRQALAFATLFAAPSLATTLLLGASAPQFGAIRVASFAILAAGILVAAAHAPGEAARLRRTFAMLAAGTITLTALRDG
ncbi:MAG: hypothetical protein AAFR52_08495 [Pseudomonadota bacterium]